MIRGICGLRPGVPGLSDRIRVRSILGRFLEHSRIFRFGSEARGRRYFLGSADLMQRNLNDRVEAVLEVDQPEPPAPARRDPARGSRRRRAGLGASERRILGPGGTEHGRGRSLPAGGAGPGPGEGARRCPGRTPGETARRRLRRALSEREIKLAAPQGFRAPDLNSLAPELSASPEEQVVQTAIEFDTADLRLARWDCSPRHRSSGGWTRELGDAGAGAGRRSRRRQVGRPYSFSAPGRGVRRRRAGTTIANSRGPKEETSVADFLSAYSIQYWLESAPQGYLMETEYRARAR